MTIKSFFKSVLSIVTDIKIYISRTVSWISMVNSLMLVFLVIERLNSLGYIEGDLGNSLMFVMAAWFGILVVLGWIEVNKVRAPHLESMKMMELNLPQKEIYTKVRENNERLKRIEDVMDNFYDQQSPGKGLRSKELGLQSEDSSADIDDNLDGNCECGHHAKDHSYVTQPEDDNLYCDICKCENFKSINSQQKQVKQVRREDDNFSESQASPDNVDNNSLK